MPFPRGNDRMIKKTWRRYRLLYILMLPGLLYFFIFCYIPMFGIVIAFKDFRPFEGVAGIFTSQWVGFRHFTRFFSSYYFGRLIGNTLKISFLKLLFGFPAPIILALMLNEVRNKYFLKITQTISYLPHFLSTVVIATLIAYIFSADNGPVNAVVTALGGQPVAFLQDVRYFVGILVGGSVWESVGWGSIIYLAAICSISPELTEAAIMDGAGKMRQIWHVTLPGMSPVIALMLIFSIGGLLNAGFEQILLLYSPGVYSVADIIDTYVYRSGIVDSNYSFATAVGLFKNVLAVILVVGSNKIANKMGYEGVW